MVSREIFWLYTHTAVTGDLSWAFRRLFTLSFTTFPFVSLFYIPFAIAMRLVSYCSGINKIHFPHYPYGEGLTKVSQLEFVNLNLLCLALTGPTGQPIRQAEASVFPSFFSQLKSWLLFCLNFPSLGLKKITAYQTEHFGLENFSSVFQYKGENFSLEKKRLNSLSFLVLLCVSGHFKQKKISNFLSDG